MASYWDIKASLTCLSCLLSRGGRREYIASLHPRPSVRGEESHPTRGDPVYAEHSGSKGVILEKQSPILRRGCRAYGMNGSGLVCRKRPLWELGDLPDVCSLTRHGGPAWWTSAPPQLPYLWITTIAPWTYPWTSVGMAPSTVVGLGQPGGHKMTTWREVK